MKGGIYFRVEEKVKRGVQLVGVLKNTLDFYQ